MRVILIIGQMLRTVSVLAFACVMVTSCSPQPSHETGKLSVVANFYPIAEAAEKIGGDLVTVTNLTPPGVEPHDLELTPSQIVDVSTADVVLYMGGGFQPAVEDAVQQARGMAVDLTSHLRSLPVPPGDEESLAADPHVWLDPKLYLKIVSAAESVMAKAAPANAATFARNASLYEGEIRSVDSSYRRGLSDCARNVIVTSHAAFGYLAREYGLRQEPIAGLSPDAEPSPDRLAELAALVKRDGVTTIFTEELVSPRVAQALALDTGATTAVLDPLESLTPSELSAGDDYVTVMRGNLRTLRTALGCT
jgi:zinc transport system substrate-binding protein